MSRPIDGAFDHDDVLLPVMQAARARMAAVELAAKHLLAAFGGALEDYRHEVSDAAPSRWPSPGDPPLHRVSDKVVHLPTGHTLCVTETVESTGELSWKLSYDTTHEQREGEP